MGTIEKINLILKKTNISKVNLAKYLGVSRQMVYNYLDDDNLSKMPAEKSGLLFNLLEVNKCEDIKNIELTDEYLQSVSNKVFNYRKKGEKKEIIELNGLNKEEQELLSDITNKMKELLENDDNKNTNFKALKYLDNFVKTIPNMKETKYILGYISKNSGFTKTNVYEFDENNQFIFESIMYSAMTLYMNGGASKSRLAESHKRWELELERKNEEKLSRTEELNTAKVQALKELGYNEINEKNAREVFDKIAEIEARNL